MISRETLERQASEAARSLVSHQVESSEMIDFRAGTYLLAAVAAEIGERVRARCREQSRRSSSQWDLAAAEAETLITASWRCMETISALSDGFHDAGPPFRAEP